jgi:uncharacterized repeat protein (TIGR03803 family)
MQNAPVPGCLKGDLRMPRVRCFLCLVLFAVILPVAHAQTFTVIHNFSGGADGATPDTGLIDAAGNFYGTAESGGNTGACNRQGCGVVFKLSPKNSGWVLSSLYAFGGDDDGSAPRTGLTFGPDGALYGTTVNGGGQDFGTVYKLQPPTSICHSVVCSWTETILHRFAAGSDGAYPSGGVTFDAAGNLYGTTDGGGGSQFCAINQGCGVVYELSPAGGWNETLLYTFAGGADGQSPEAGLVANSAGDFFGTCLGGARGGFVYELTPSGSGWSKSFIYSFTGGADGYTPIGLIIDTSGNLYGATTFGGPQGGGTVYQLSPSGGGWHYLQLNALMSGNPHLYGPIARLTMDAAGNLYGTTFQGGQHQAGSVFKLTPAVGTWTYTSLHDFTGGSDGGNPGSRVLLDAQGNVYGAAHFGGSFSHGVAFKIAQ